MLFCQIKKVKSFHKTVLSHNINSFRKITTFIFLKKQKHSLPLAMAYLCHQAAEILVMEGGVH